jgi:iron complex transport system permease protein
LNSKFRWLRFLLFLLVLLVLFSLLMGHYEISWVDMKRLLFLPDGESLSPADMVRRNVILHIRLPRILAAVLCGSALAVSGVAMQSLFRNPMVSPGILGVLSGSAFGAALGLCFSCSWFTVQLLSFFFGCVAAFLSWGLALVHGQKDILVMILGGMIVNSFFTSLLSLVKYVADPYDKLPSIVYWLMGSLTKVELNTALLFIAPVAVCIFLIFICAYGLNAASLGDEQARALGVNMTFLRVVVIFCATFLSAMTVSMAGMIGWIGLVVPHVVRLLFGSDLRLTIPFSALGGAVFLLGVDNISRTMMTSEIPVGILTSLLGIPVFALVLGKAGKRWTS